MLLVLSSNPLSHAAVWFVPNNMVLSKFNAVACGLSLISLSNDEKTRSDAEFVVGAFFVSYLSSSDGLCRFPSSTLSIFLAIVKQKLPIITSRAICVN